MTTHPTPPAPALRLRLMGCALFGAAALWFSPPAAAADARPPAAGPGVSAAELDKAISEIVARPEYGWRLPRENRGGEGGQVAGFMEALGKIVKRWVDKGIQMLRRLWHKVHDWLDRLFSRKKPADRPADLRWAFSLQGLLFLLLAVTAATLGIILYRMWRNRGRVARTAVARPVVAPTPDILNQPVAADHLPWDEWMRLARECLDRGEFRLAVRAMFLACLAFLAHHEKLTIAGHKSNREYIAELRRRAHDQPELLTAFADHVRSLEKVWYGRHPATENLVQVFTENHDRMIRMVSPPAAPAAGGPGRPE